MDQFHSSGSHLLPISWWDKDVINHCPRFQGDKNSGADCRGTESMLTSTSFFHLSPSLILFHSFYSLNITEAIIIVISLHRQKIGSVFTEKESPCESHSELTQSKGAKRFLEQERKWHLMFSNVKKEWLIRILTLHDKWTIFSIFVHLPFIVTASHPTLTSYLVPSSHSSQSSFL